MTAEHLIYTAVALSALLSLGALIAFFRCERRCRKQEREAPERLTALRMQPRSTDLGDEVKPQPIQIRRPFHEALLEDAPELAPSPRTHAIADELAARQRNQAHDTENHEMNLRHLAAAASLGLAACAQFPTDATPPTQGDARMAQSDYVAPRPQVTWSFDRHSFGAYCYNTIGCEVLYANFYDVNDEADEVSPPPESAGVQKYWGGTHVGIDNFPPPATVTWRSLDGTAHVERVDIGEIFKDHQVLHDVPSEKLGWNATMTGMSPEIVLVVNDRTISVYMGTFVVLKEPEIPGNRYSGARDEFLLAWRHTY